MRREKRSVTNFIEALTILARYMEKGVDTQYFIESAHDQIWISTNDGNPGVLTKDGQRLDELGFFYDESVGSWSQYT